MDYLLIAIGAILTIVIETVFFVLFEFRTKKFIVSCVVVNFTTNLILNFFLLTINNYNQYLIILIVSEILVIAFESFVLFLASDKKYEVIPLTISSNCLSFLFGLLFYFLINL